MDAVDLLRTLVAFDTTPRRSNLPLVEWVSGYLADAGARIRLTRDGGGAKANVLATFGPDAPGGVVLSAHTDVVPVTGQDWASDPFTLIERDGRLYGRGTADMKGFIAACLAAVPRWSGSGLRRPVHLALSYDEESGCLGVPRLIADLVEHVPRPALAIVGEPTGLGVADRHRGYLGFRTVFHGRAAHSSDPARGVSAIAAAARFVARLDGLDLDGTTVNAGTITGGTAMNIVPARCEVGWEIRPGADAALDDLRALAAGLLDGEPGPPETEEILTIPPLRPEPGNPAVELARRLGDGGPPAYVPFGTEAGLFQAAGIPAAVCGPGSIDQAHRPDEWIDVRQLTGACRFLEGVTQWVRTPAG